MRLLHGVLAGFRDDPRGMPDSLFVEGDGNCRRSLARTGEVPAAAAINVAHDRPLGLQLCLRADAQDLAVFDDDLRGDVLAQSSPNADAKVAEDLVRRSPS